MFSSGVPMGATKFVSDDGNEFFKNFHYNTGYNGDYSFQATMRALLAPRTQSEETVHFLLTYFVHEYERNKDATKKVLMDTFWGIDTYGIRVCFVATGNSEGNSKWMNFIRETFGESFDGYEKVPKVHEFFKKHFEIECYINVDKKSTKIFVSGTDFNMKNWHYLQVGIPAFFPWYFDGTGVSDDEMAVIQSLTQRNINVYLSAMEKLVEQYDVDSVKIRKFLAGFETKFEQVRISRAKNALASTINDINGLNRRCADLFELKREQEIELLGLYEMMNKRADESEVMDYFISHKQLMLKEVDNTQIRFFVKTYAEFYDEDFVERILDNDRSYLYRPENGTGHTVSPEDMAMLVRAIFIDQNLKLRFVAGYTLDVVRGVGNIKAQYEGIQDYIPNPHIEEYNCMGDYVPTINSALRSYDYVTALDQCIASAKSLNFADSAVMHRFMGYLYGTRNDINNRGIELPDGSVVTPKEAIEFLKKEKENGGDAQVESDN